MKNNEKFIKIWEKNRKKGKFRFIIEYILMFLIIYCTITLIIHISKGYGLSKLANSLEELMALLVGTTIGTIINWYRNEDKYNKLMKNNSSNESD